MDRIAAACRPNRRIVRSSSTAALLARFCLAVVVACSPSLALRRAAADDAERPPMVTVATEKAIERGMRYLANTQSADGSWRSQGGYGGGYPTAMTALAGLALMAGGNTPVEGEYSRNVRLAVDHLLSNSDRSTGLIARLNEESSCMHGHGFAMLCLAQAYGMERDEKRQSVIRAALERSIRLTAQSQSGRGGWLYQPNSGGDEGSVTVTQIQGLRACRDAGISVPKEVIEKACEYIKLSAQPDGGIAYSAGQSGSRPAITAAAVAVMYSAGQYENDVALKALDYTKNLIKTHHGTIHDGHKFYAMLYASQAMYLSALDEDPKHKDNWTLYFPLARDDLLRTQSNAGSWEGDGVGDVYGTSIACIVLQLPYGNLPIFQR